jgi:hypothetical protein
LAFFVYQYYEKPMQDYIRYGGKLRNTRSWASLTLNQSKEKPPKGGFPISLKLSIYPAFWR